MCEWVCVFPPQNSIEHRKCALTQVLSNRPKPKCLTCVCVRARLQPITIESPSVYLHINGVVLFLVLMTFWPHLCCFFRLFISPEYIYGWQFSLNERNSLATCYNSFMSNCIVNSNENAFFPFFVLFLASSSSSSQSTRWSPSSVAISLLYCC